MKKIADEIIHNGQRHLSLRSAARMSGYHKDYLGQMIRLGELPAVRAGRSHYIEHEKLLQFLQIKNRTPKHGISELSRQYADDQTSRNRSPLRQLPANTHSNFAKLFSSTSRRAASVNKKIFFELRRISIARLLQCVAFVVTVAIFVFAAPLFAQMDFMAPKLSLVRVLRHARAVSENTRVATQKELKSVLQIAAPGIDRTITALAKRADEQWETIAHETDELLGTARGMYVIALDVLGAQRKRTTHQITEIANDLSFIYANAAQYFREPIIVSRNSFASLPASFQGAVKEAELYLNSTTDAFSSAGGLVLHIPATAISTFRQTRENISHLAVIPSVKKAARYQPRSLSAAPQSFVKTSPHIKNLIAGIIISIDHTRILARNAIKNQNSLATEG